VPDSRVGGHRLTTEGDLYACATFTVKRSMCTESLEAEEQITDSPTHVEAHPSLSLRKQAHTPAW
jgi:hypothetical protein